MITLEMKSVGASVGGRLCSIAMVFTCIGCVAPSMVGFVHPEPAPANGYEATVGLLGGGELMVVDGETDPHGYVGGGISFAGRIREMGLSVSAWLADVSLDVIEVGGHLELAVPLTGQADADPSTAGMSRLYLLGGLGYTAGIPDSHRPQLSLGLLRSAPAKTSGGFWGARLSGGFAIGDNDNILKGFYGVGVSVSGGIGYRWYSENGTIYPSVQLAPLVDVIFPHGDEPVFTGLGLLAILALGFNG